MKKIFGYLILLTAYASISAYANESHQTLNQYNSKIYTQLNDSDSLTVTYDLTRSPIYRQHEWFSYALFCFARGKATIEYTHNNKQATAKLPFLASNYINEDGQEGIGSEIDKRGTLIIRNKSEFYSGSEITCALYPKFGE